jgi:hypothetical protein
MVQLQYALEHRHVWIAPVYRIQAPSRDEAKIGTRDRLREGPRETDVAPAEVPERQDAPVIRVATRDFR